MTAEKICLRVGDASVIMDIGVTMKKILDCDAGRLAMREAINDVLDLLDCCDPNVLA